MTPDAPAPSSPPSSLPATTLLSLIVLTALTILGFAGLVISGHTPEGYAVLALAGPGGLGVGALLSHLGIGRKLDQTATDVAALRNGEMEAKIRRTVGEALVEHAINEDKKAAAKLKAERPKR